MKWQRRHKTQHSQVAVNAERRSNQELLQEIEQILETSSAADMDVDRLEMYLDFLQERVPLMENYDVKAEWKKQKSCIRSCLRWSRQNVLKKQM